MRGFKFGGFVAFAVPLGENGGGGRDGVSILVEDAEGWLAEVIQRCSKASSLGKSR